MYTYLAMLFPEAQNIAAMLPLLIIVSLQDTR